VSTRPPDRHEEVSGPHLHLAQIDFVGWHQLEFVERAAAGGRLGRHRSLGDDQRDGQCCDKGQARE
jgi:hypothetical protein